MDPKAQDAATHLLNALMDDKALDVAKSEVSQSQNTNKAQEGGATR